MRRMLNTRSVATLVSIFALRGYDSFLVRPYCAQRPFGHEEKSSSLKVADQSLMSAVDTPSWSDLKAELSSTAVGRALDQEVQLRQEGKGSAHVQNRLRKFNSENEPPIILYRDHAGWCPYCQKTMLLVEEKHVPIKIELVPMRSYGDKPQDFLRKVPGGLLPAIEVNGQIITESSVIMELLDEWHQEGYKPMMPSNDKDRAEYGQLARLERELFSWWCTLIFRPELPGAKNMLSGLLGGSGGNNEMSGSMQGFMDCIRKVDAKLLATDGPWFFATDYPTMIDFIYVSHVERMLASCAYWKGLNLRDPKWKLKGLNNWLEAFEKREAYLAFKSDYYTHIKDIPPQYGPGYVGGFRDEQQKFENSIAGRDGSWTIPLSHDDSLQPLYTGPPLPLCVLQACGLEADATGSYVHCDSAIMSQACRTMAAWKLAGNGLNIVKFSSRGGPSGSKNSRKTFGAELADPYAAPDETIRPFVDVALRIVCASLVALKSDKKDEIADLESVLRAQIPSSQVNGVIGCLIYLRDRVGVPRDLPLAAARHLRAHLNWAISALDP